jgi:hypothetical protein
MTRKDYSTIQRKLGYIEGVLAWLDDDKGVIDRIREINEILNKEKFDDVKKGVKDENDWC